MILGCTYIIIRFQSNKIQNTYLFRIFQKSKYVKYLFIHTYFIGVVNCLEKEWMKKMKQEKVMKIFSISFAKKYLKNFFNQNLSVVKYLQSSSSSFYNWDEGKKSFRNYCGWIKCYLMRGDVFFQLFEDCLHLQLDFASSYIFNNYV